MIQADPKLACAALVEALEKGGFLRHDDDWFAHFHAAEESSWRVLAEFEETETFEGRVVIDMLDELSEDSYLHVASSLPVRHLDQYARPQSKAIRASANRGASGIDGTISTGLGIAAALGKHVVILMGDLALYHDMNALIGLGRFGLTATVVVINNDGGGIFHRLPVSKFEPPFTELFVTPHGLKFAPLAELFSMQYVYADEREAFHEAFQSSVKESRSCLIEVPSDSAKEELFRHRFLQAVSERIAMGVLETA
jgi:2-succinyl-5-enolpyruvyl-6-hydroxy-3-cyclohexene-1-carboxylate synthase